MRRWYLLAAALIGLLIVAKFVLSPSVTAEDLYQEHFRPYPNVFEPTVRGSAHAGARTEAFKAYEKGDYSNAANLFTQLLQGGPDPGMLLLLGNCNLILGNTDDAIRNFIDLKAQSTELTLQSNWFLGLAYLKNGDREKALLLLRELSVTESSYAGKSRDIIKQLE
jgi:tetratricopeptide (TPR) repeat protein